jgi:hypothetical protein
LIGEVRRISFISSQQLLMDFYFTIFLCDDVFVRRNVACTGCVSSGGSPMRWPVNICERDGRMLYYTIPSVEVTQELQDWFRGSHLQQYLGQRRMQSSENTGTLNRRFRRTVSLNQGTFQ